MILFFFSPQKKKSAATNSNNKDHPPVTALNKIKPMAGLPQTKKDKRQNSSRYNLTQNRELQRLPLLRGRKLYDHLSIYIPEYIKHIYLVLLDN